MNTARFRYVALHQVPTKTNTSTDEYFRSNTAVSYRLPFTIPGYSAVSPLLQATHFELSMILSQFSQMNTILFRLPMLQDVAVLAFFRYSSPPRSQRVTNRTDQSIFKTEYRGLIPFTETAKDYGIGSFPL